MALMLIVTRLETLGTFMFKLTFDPGARSVVEIIAGALEMKIVAGLSVVVVGILGCPRETFRPQVVINDIPRGLRFDLLLESELHVILVCYWKVNLPMLSFNFAAYCTIGKHCDGSCSATISVNTLKALFQEL